MAKAKSKQNLEIDPNIPEIIEIPPKEYGIYNKENRVRIENIMKLINAQQKDIEEIYSLYKLFINPNARTISTTGCSSCGASTPIKYWNELGTFYNKNKDKFEN